MVNLSDQNICLPKVFLSYRWESREHKAWVSGFAAALTGRLINVAFDQNIRNTVLGELQPAYVVNEITSCHIFIPILTRGYIERIWDFFQPHQAGLDIGIAIRTELRVKGKLVQSVHNGGRDDGWVFDEFQQYILQNKIRKKSLGGCMPFAPVLRDNCIENLPPGFPIDIITDFRGVDLHRCKDEHKRLLDTFGSLVHDFTRRFPIPKA